MQIFLSSGSYDIITSGQAFLFSKDSDFRIEIQENRAQVFSIILNFIEDQSCNQDIRGETNGNDIILTCINFQNTGSGTKEPVEVASIDDKKLYLAFWSYLEGAGSRSVKYTIFKEK